jgi:hypothetical protein
MPDTKDIASWLYLFLAGQSDVASAAFGRDKVHQTVTLRDPTKKKPNIFLAGAASSKVCIGRALSLHISGDGSSQKSASHTFFFKKSSINLNPAVSSSTRYCIYNFVAIGQRVSKKSVVSKHVGGGGSKLCVRDSS